MLGMNERFVVLCSDSAASGVQAGLRSPGDSAASAAQFILGIRAAKGLEFADVIILDFFGALPDADYRAWKELLDADSDGGAEQGGLSAYAHPQLEPRGLAERCTMLDIDAGSAEQGAGPVLMTTDEWKARGIDLALSEMFDQAIYCFQRANCTALRSMAMVCAQVAQGRASLLSPAESLTSNAPRRELSAAEEVQLAGLIVRCLRAGLRREAQELCKLAAPALISQSECYFVPEIVMKF
jgi:hypothetical protein